MLAMGRCGKNWIKPGCTVPIRLVMYMFLLQSSIPVLTSLLAVDESDENLATPRATHKCTSLNIVETSICLLQAVQ
ncbi:hypothetical protein EDB92DRAFT_1886940 [Lactarius akahatsu]|uniref:Uncharacterized protein n=1 Tax=Lactarius akahatsu TaxID=416441 RepID=A0AAD4QA62_9AGAM|nr:hypothetical protein EDB92DRAFT_1886940 [Lactarius akahatsu]